MKKQLLGIALFISTSTLTAFGEQKDSTGVKKQKGESQMKTEVTKPQGDAFAQNLAKVFNIKAPVKGDAFVEDTSEVDNQKGEPFEGMDLTWLNGADRRHVATLANKYFTPDLLVDVNYTQSNHNPIDHTVVGSTALSRDNEVQLAGAFVGGSFQYGHARACLQMMFGTNSTVIPRDDYSSNRGQYNLQNVYRNLGNANCGYHWNKWNGINIDFGMFTSYIGLNSYFQAENWEYQASYTSDNTPWFFNGIRVQIFPNSHWKFEPWLINGWQSYGMFNNQPSIGGNLTYIPTENFKILSNDYWGADEPNSPGNHRFHSDNSALGQYINHPSSSGISKAAWSITADIGYEKGDGVDGFKTNGGPNDPCQYFLSGMIYHRMWFNHNRFAWTIGGGVLDNPGRYLVLFPTGEASPLPNPNNPNQVEGAYPFLSGNGLTFRAWDCSTNFDIIPKGSEHILFRIEFVYRSCNVPYFAGHGGVTSPTGYALGYVPGTGTPNANGATYTAVTQGTMNGVPTNWLPDLVKTEARIIFAIEFRL